jgi:hypothetical protein
MITTSELRIGDWVTEHPFSSRRPSGEPYQITLEDFYYLQFLNPIPLTEDWLLKFGFEKINHVHGYVFYSHRKSKISVYLDMKIEWMGYLTACKTYVHQLQNLYFALTGEELILKEEPS